MGLIQVNHGNVYQFTTLGTSTVSLGQIAGTQEIYTKQFLTGLTASGSLTVTGSVKFINLGSAVPTDKQLYYNSSTGNVTYSTLPQTSSYICQGILAGNQSIPNNTDTVIDFVDQFDTQNWWNPSTKRFTPTIAGYYQVAFGGWLQDPGTSTGQTNLQCRKNGVTHIINQFPLTAGTGQGLAGSKIFSMNGTTDYIDFTIYHNAGSAKNILQGNSDGSGTWFSAYLITK